MTTVAINRVEDGVLASADTATLAITDSTGAVVLAATVIPPASAGVYRHSINILVPGVYTATWTFAKAGYPTDTVHRIFQVDTPAAAVTGVTLAEIERAIAARIGPYDRVRAAAGSTISSAVVNKLKSTLMIGDYEERFLLRRGVYTTGDLIENFSEDDRSRIVASHTPASGTLTADQPWSMAPQINEWLELHYLDPDHLRAAALEGLRRCYFQDTISLSATTYLREVNLTASAPWITRPGQVRRIQYGRASYNPVRAPWYETYQVGGEVWMRTAIPNVGTVRIDALRPHFTYVNDTDTLNGPDHDEDILRVDREYAARAGHVAAWMLFTPRLAPVAAQGLAITMKMAADAFTLSSMGQVKQEPEMIQNRFGQDDIIDWLQVGNA